MVSRASMTTLAHMSTDLWRAMDAKAELVACMLPHKAGESNLFIREDKDLALGAMVQSCSPTQVQQSVMSSHDRSGSSSLRHQLPDQPYHWPVAYSLGQRKACILTCERKRNTERHEGFGH
ncbi:TOG array regulator of axonemal microtubules protein 1-like [Electrophorus electricus]|uniref:TOG array regulator of axonemal microtubules protein 1-like n=1 Tax=Electrophorus electricus TaxID=8005 RepID=UPI0015D045A5|nr:TOG array regulator of axonemal microtubules protein 1-like [Electrophorus electricus]XP_035378947.1 TOG array regulator of axonemal microtubules protein 1-like [Electrophorus electricus]